jgi:hypothetical protein
MSDPLSALLTLCEKATPGPWQVATDEHPHHLGGKHIERRIFTVKHDPQLKGPWGIVNSSVGIGAEKDAATRHMVAISEPDAAYIAACSPEVIAALVRIAQLMPDILALAEHEGYRDGPTLAIKDALRDLDAALAQGKE